MAKTSYILVPENHDGTSQRGRALPALDPGHVSIDERSTADLLAFVQAFVAKLRFFDVDAVNDALVEVPDGWTNFANRADISIDDMVAYIAEPSRFEGEVARWLGRPHFALLLTFLELLGQARGQLNDLTRRHLDYYYREVLRMLPAAAIPDRAAVVFRLAPRASQVRLPAGTALQAGRDADGIARIYKTERDVYVSRAQVQSLRSVYVRRDITGLADVWVNKGSGAGDAVAAFEQMLAIALGEPRPGDEVPAFQGVPIDADFIASLLPKIAFAKAELLIEHHELRALMRLGKRLSPAPTPQTDPEWPGILSMLEELGRIHHDDDDWDIGAPANFAAALALAFVNIPWKPEFGTVVEYYDYIRDLERHFSMPIERVEQLAVAAEDPDEANWTLLERILTDAHVEKDRAARQQFLLDEILAGRSDSDGFHALVSYVLGESIEENNLEVAPDSFSWTVARAGMAGYLQPGQLVLLDIFRTELLANEDSPTYEWEDVARVLELVWSGVEGFPDPVPELIEWHNLYAYDDASAVVDVTEAARWKTFGRAPKTDEVVPPQASLGWALRSSMLALNGGDRTLTLTLAFVEESFNVAALEAAFMTNLAGLGTKMSDELAVEVTTAKGWMPVPITGTAIVQYDPDADGPEALQLELTLDPSFPAVEPLPDSGERWPTLRILLKQRLDGSTYFAPFEPLELAFVHLAVDVVGLVGLQIQHEDKALDPRRPFEPFGSQPALGSRFYLSHPELVRARLDTLDLRLEWMGLPTNLATHYLNYPASLDVTQINAAIALIENNAAHGITDAGGSALFVGVQDSVTTLAFNPVLQTAGYDRRFDVEPTDDIRDAIRYLRVELTGSDCGHAIYPPTAANLASELAMRLATADITAAQIPTEAPKYRINPPYTPKIKTLSVDYSTSIEIDPTAIAGEDELLHIHPFGTTRIAPDDNSFLPRYEHAGELYIGLRDVAPPQNLSLLVQLAEGTSDPELEPSPVKWSYLDGDRWQGCDVAFDSTRGLLNSGIVELQLPTVAPSTRLPAGLFWLRVTIDRNTQSVCDTVAIMSQAGIVRFDDRGNAASHYEQPLPVGSINRLLAPDARIAAIEQPFTSFGGKPPERDEHLNTRVSERLRHKQRALTAWDYERLVLHRFSQVFKAKCLPAAASGGAGRVDVVVIPDIRNALPGDPFAPKAPTNLLADIQEYLAERAPATATVQVRNARYRPVLLRLAVRFRSGWDEGFAKKQLNEDLNRFLSPWAYDQGAELEIGGKIYANSIIDFVDRLDYIDHVANLRLFTVVGNNVQAGSISPSGEYYVAASQPDTVLVAARQHHIEVIPESGYQIVSFTGIGYMKIELDFIVA